MSLFAKHAINLVEKGYVPDSFIRKGIHRLLKKRLKEIYVDKTEELTASKNLFIHDMRKAPIALVPEKANEQHYEVPVKFYELVLGRHNKYSCCFWDENTQSLSNAEENALALTCSYAQLINGQSILEMGCGWGSLTLWIAQKYPQSQITAVSNSQSQRQHIEARAQALGLTNIEVITSDMNDFNIDKQFDRVVSVEMFEHMRNWELLFRKIAGWLNDNGKFFMHVFTNRQAVYSYEVKDSSDWMSEYFFTGGMMPSDDLPLYFQQHLTIESTWSWDGNHYAKTSNAWLRNMDDNKVEVMKVITDTYDEDSAKAWWMRWRMFFMACAELFAFDNGQQWHVMHYTFNKASK